MRELVRSTARWVGAGLLVIGVLGMGALGGEARDGTMPERDFRAVSTDADGTRVEITRVTAGGDASLEGTLGRGRLRIPFDNIARIRLTPGGKERDTLSAEVTLRQGEPVTLGVRSSTTFYGRTPSGAYQIRARDLRSVEFTDG